jgi:hypothetical protein
MGDGTDSVKDTLNELGVELDYQLANDDWAREPIWKKPLRWDTRIAVAIGAFVAVAMVVAAATMLFTHTFPSGVTGARLTTSCTALTMGTPSAPVGPGTVRFNCGSSNPAVVADGSGAVTPTFTLTGTLYTGLTIVPAAPIGTACSGGTTLLSGTAVTPAAGSYDYCASYVGSGALTGFRLDWSQ